MWEQIQAHPFIIERCVTEVYILVVIENPNDWRGYSNDLSNGESYLVCSMDTIWDAKRILEGLFLDV